MVCNNALCDPLQFFGLHCWSILEEFLRICKAVAMGKLWGQVRFWSALCESTTVDFRDYSLSSIMLNLVGGVE